MSDSTGGAGVSLSI